MTTAQRIAIAAAFVASGALCFAIGRASAPRPTCPPCEAVAKCADKADTKQATTTQASTAGEAKCAPTAAAKIRYLPAPPGPGCQPCPGLEVDVTSSAPTDVGGKADCKQETTTVRREERAAEAAAKVQPAPAESRLRLTTDLLGGVRLDDRRALVGAAGTLQFERLRLGAWLMTEPTAPIKGLALGANVGWTWR